MIDLANYLSKRSWLCSCNQPGVIRTLLFFIRFLQNLVSKISGRYVDFFWSTVIFICTILCSSWNMLTFTSGKELFWWVYIGHVFRLSSEAPISIIRLTKYIVSFIRYTCMLMKIHRTCKNYEFNIHYSKPTWAFRPWTALPWHWDSSTTLWKWCTVNYCTYFLSTITMANFTWRLSWDRYAICDMTPIGIHTWIDWNY